MGNTSHFRGGRLDFVGWGECFLEGHCNNKEDFGEKSKDLQSLFAQKLTRNRRERQRVEEYDKRI